MSIGATDVQLIHHPATGTIRERFTVDLGVSEQIRGVGDTSEKATLRAVGRIYGDIARDFEKFLALVGEPEGKAAEIRDVIREKLRGGGAVPLHRAPEPLLSD